MQKTLWPQAGDFDSLIIIVVIGIFAKTFARPTVGSIACGAFHSLAAVAVGPPFITSRLANRSVSMGGTVFFRVEANGA